jgi:surfeit locus 1 family protein
MTAERQPFRLNFWMTVCAVPALMILLGLGFWQVQRLEWKQAIINERAERLAAPPLDIASVSATSWQEVEHRRVKITGKYLHDREILLLNSVRHGQNGFDLITPMALESGGTVLVNRGWVPRDWPQPESRGGLARRRPSGTVERTGILRAGGKRGNPWIPDNEPARDQWYFPDVAQMAAKARLADARPYFIELAPGGNLEGYPKGPHASSAIRNKHLEYAITWFGLAATLLVIYVLYHIRRRD